MKRSRSGVFLTIALSAGLIGYVIFRYSIAAPKAPSSEITPTSETAIGVLPTPGPEQSIPRPPPPPRPVGEKAQPSPLDRQRTLTGVTPQQLTEIERYLPAGSKVATYALSEGEQRAALATDDGNIVVVYRTPVADRDASGQSLFLGVLRRDGNNLTLRSSTPLYGGMIYTSLYDKQVLPFAILDVTGDGRNEIVVTTGVGASLGGALQVYSFDGTSLHQIAFAQGHTLHLKSTGPGRPSEITAQSRYEDKPRVYRWNGQSFLQTGQ